MLETEIIVEWRREGKACGSALRVKRELPGIQTVTAPEPSTDALELHLTIPLHEINGIWMPYGDRSSLQKLVWKGQETSTPVFKPGLTALVDRDLRSRFIFIPEPAECEALVAWQIDQAGGAYQVTVTWAPTAEPFTPAVRFSTELQPVHTMARRMFAAILPGPAESRAPLAYEPSYCTWYAFHAALEQKRVEECAELAAQLGFGSFILDDGWMYDAMQRVQGAVGPWFRRHGDYEPSTRKFPDFPGHIQRVKALGMRFILWAAPFTVGIESQARRKLEGHLLTSWLDEGFLVADPRSPMVVEHLESTFAELVRRYPVDGFKVDYDYALIGPGPKLYGLGRAYREAVRRMIAAVRHVNPRIEWNLMANACTCGLTDAFRCSDVPFDPETNRLWMANLKALVGNRVLHYDPALWRPDAPLATVHRHLVPALFCIPSVGADLLALPPPHREALRDWLGFYRRHQPVLNGGEFEPVWAAGDYQSFRATLGNRQIAATFSAFPVEVGAVPETLLINAGGSATVNLAAAAKLAVSVENARGEGSIPARSLGPGLHQVSCAPGAVLRIQQG